MDRKQSGEGCIETGRSGKGEQEPANRETNNEDKRWRVVQPADEDRRKELDREARRQKAGLGRVQKKLRRLIFVDNYQGVNNADVCAGAQERY